jgi:hypothetical protein
MRNEIFDAGNLIFIVTPWSEFIGKGSGSLPPQQKHLFIPPGFIPNK